MSVVLKVDREVYELGHGYVERGAENHDENPDDRHGPAWIAFAMPGAISP